VFSNTSPVSRSDGDDNARFSDIPATS